MTVIWYCGACRLPVSFTFQTAEQTDGTVEVDTGMAFEVHMAQHA